MDFKRVASISKPNRSCGATTKTFNDLLFIINHANKMRRNARAILVAAAKFIAQLSAIVASCE